MGMLSGSPGTTTTAITTGMSASTMVATPSQPAFLPYLNMLKFLNMTPPRRDPVPPRAAGACLVYTLNLKCTTSPSAMT